MHNIDTQTILQLTSLCYQKGDLDLSYHYSSQLLIEEPDNTFAMIIRARVSNEWKSYQNAIEELDYLLEFIDKENAEALQLREDILLSLKSEYSWKMYG